MRLLRDQGKRKHRDREGLKQSRRHVKKEAEAGSERCTSPAALEMEEIYKPRNAKDFWRPSEAGRVGPILGLCSLCFVSRGFCALLASPNIITISALCLPAHHMQETDINSRRSFAKVSDPPPKPALDLLSSIPNRLQAQLDPGAIQYTGFLFIV